MPNFNPINPTKYTGTNKYITFFVSRKRRPTGADYRQPETGTIYSDGTIWQISKNPTTGTEGELWMLSKIVANVAYWVTVSAGSLPPALSFNTPDANVVFPTALGVVNFLNGAGISITGATPNSITITNTSQAQTYVTNVNSPAIPLLGILNVIGGTTEINNNNGLRTDGSTNNNILTVQITNRLSGSVITSDATPTALITFAMSPTNLGSAIGVATFDIQITGYNTTDNAGVGYAIFGSVRTTGAATILIDTPDKIVNEEASQVTADANLIVSGNNVIVQVTGIALKTINWKAVGVYVFTN